MKKKKAPGEIPYTRQIKQLRQEKEFWQNLGIQDPEDAPHHVNHVDLRGTTINDDQLALMVGRVRSSEMLDLNDTEISNEGISHLTRMEYLAELRLKECRQIDNDCISFLNQIPGLRLLYLKSTPVNIDGLLNLTSVPKLEELFFSDPDELITEEKMVKLAALLPNTTLIIDGKTFR